MKLKSLEIKGFKSFANPTVINFNDNVVGIVGPNGSGKSNIVDAIRWVLGEQKGKELRLDKKIDVIFNGAKSKKASGAAQVSITFENTKNILPTEFNNVTLTRILYRNGDSEYRLNGVKCRLKDISNLLLDTGIGSNSYAIIALGMVEDILKDKDHARRKMFEQVSGISKYKKRKRETINKLRSTTEDLDRVEDLLFEILGNMKTLEKQAKRAEKYFDLKKKYKELSLEHAALSISDLKEKHVKYKKEIDDSQDLYRDLEAKVHRQEAAIEKEKQSHLDSEKNLSEKQQVVNKLIHDIREAEASRDLLKQELNFKTESLENAENSLVNNKKLSDQLNADLSEKEKGVKIKKDEIEILQKDFESFSAKQEEVRAAYMASKEVLDASSLQRQEIEDKLIRLSTDQAVLVNKITVLSEEKKRQESELSSKESSISELQKSFDKISKDKEEKKTKLDYLEYQQSEVVKIQESKASERNELQEKVSRIERSLDAKNNEHDLMKSMIDNLEGYPESIKFLTKSLKKETSILSDILDVEKDYKGIIEHFLEPFLNYFVVGNMEEASKAIDVLQQAQKGKAHFFLLDSFSRSVSRSIPVEGAIEASTLVKVDKKYSSLLDALLKNVFIYPGKLTDEAIKKYDDCIFLSAQGNYIKRANEVSGGSVGLFEGKKIGRKKDLEKLVIEIKKLEGGRAKIEKAIEAIDKDLSRLNSEKYIAEINEARIAHSLLSDQLIQINTRIQSESESIQNLNQKSQLISEEIVATNDRIKNIKIEIVAQEKIKSSSAGKEVDSNHVEELSQKLNEETAKFNQKNIELIQQKSQLENLERELQFSTSRMSELSMRLEEGESQIRVTKESLEKLNSQIAEIEEGLTSKYKERDLSKSDLSEIEQLYFGNRNKIAEMEEALKTTSRKQQQTQVRINQLKDKFSDVKFEMSSVGERLKIEFETTLDVVLGMEIDDTKDVAELHEVVSKMRNRINNFGDINPMAVEAYNTMKERHDLIEGQRNDILDAKDSLLVTIKEIEDTATSLFLDTFWKVRANFIEVFRSLFSEDDSCDLILLDEENPLESDIDIIARPKGKRPLSLSQLSGGEMTLTATALLFALYLQKPAPFCIFDEVDAPLDDANVLKFNKIIKKFSKDSQFVIVTHNKSTMAEVDVLYGVYMQEMGVSSVSPVDFRSFKHDATLESVK